ncbi:trypsin-like serine peptidase [Amycolatopsis sp. NPDC059657]|uniref:trypsin-like serine peptidase n=1 Tax=Amycolatopsis sp. NPDC059657 TaxID=3346899 RepID=UPI00366E88E2
MTWKKPVTLLSVLLAALVSIAVPASAAGTGQVVTRFSEADRAAALAYWTPERMKRLGEQEWLPPAETVGKPWNGAMPAGVGRLFFHAEPGGYDESCSATVVPSATKDVVLTAGHCLNGGFDRWDNVIKHVNMVFVPGYGEGAPKVFAARAFAWPDTYRGPTSATDDDGVIALDPVGGSHVADVAGVQEISFERPPSPVPTTMLGYPVSALARGEKLVSCSRPATLDVNSVSSVWETTCDLAGGSSGGPWLRNFDPATGKGTIYGVTSRGTMDENGVTTDLSAALFTDAVRDLYASADSL